MREKQNMNIYDISKAAGVSIASVSRVINGADNVSEKTREKVLKVIDQYGYTPNAYARGLGRGSMRTIGIMCSDSSDIYLANAIHYLETGLREHGYNSILCCTGYDLEDEKRSFELLKSRQVDAIIMAGSKYVELNPWDNQYIIEGAKEHPVMMVNGAIEGENIYSVICDDRGAMEESVKRLVDSGAKKLIYVYSSRSYSGIRKLEGFTAGAKETGLSEEDARIVQGKKDFHEIASLLRREFKKAPFDAVLCSSDTSGVGALKFALSEHLSVPEDLQIVSFNNSVLSTATNPELTSVDSRLEDLCTKTISLLMDILSPNPDDDQDTIRAIPKVPSKNVLEAKIVERGTTRFIRKRN